MPLSSGRFILGRYAEVVLAVELLDDEKKELKRLAKTSSVFVWLVEVEVLLLEVVESLSAELSRSVKTASGSCVFPADAYAAAAELVDEVGGGGGADPFVGARSTMSPDFEASENLLARSFSALAWPVSPLSVAACAAAFSFAAISAVTLAYCLGSIFCRFSNSFIRSESFEVSNESEIEEVDDVFAVREDEVEATLDIELLERMLDRELMVMLLYRPRAP